MKIYSILQQKINDEKKVIIDTIFNLTKSKSDNKTFDLKTTVKKTQINDDVFIVSLNVETKSVFIKGENIKVEDLPIEYLILILESIEKQLS